MDEKCSYCGEKGHSIQNCPKWKSSSRTTWTDEVKQKVRESLVYAVSSVLRIGVSTEESIMLARQIIPEFYGRLAAKSIMTKEEMEKEQSEALSLIESRARRAALFEEEL